MKSLSSEEFDKKFDKGESVVDHLDLGKARRPNLEIKRINVDFPSWIVHALDKEATRLGITRQAL